MTITLVQTAAASSGTADVSALTVTLGGLATAHNCLVACIGGFDVGAVVNVTSSGSPDHWGTTAAVTEDLTVTTCEIWVDPNCAGGNTTVTVAVTNPGLLMAQVFEFSGVLASSPADVTTVNGSASIANTSWSSGTSSAYTSGDVLVGMCASSNASVLYTMTGPSSPWINEASVGANVAPNFARMIAGYQVTSGGGTMAYAGTNTGFVRYGAAAVALKATGGGSGAAGSFLPFFG